ncbi:MAG: hypothetical protein IKW98_06480 [Prevotella sp.]|nr:hypothetical protein [Prevotella sp.]
MDNQLDITTPSPYKSLEEIRARKDSLIKEIRKDDKQIRTHWNSLFHRPEAVGLMTPTKRITGLMSTGAGVLDGLILGWKLYRKFKGKTKRR